MEKSKILVVDDTLMNVELLVEMLKEMYDVTTFTDSLKAIDYLKDHSFDVILLDLFMPGMDGFEFMDKLREFEITTPVIVISSATNLDDQIKVFKSGAIDFINKPYIPEQIYAKIKIVIDANMQKKRTVLTDLSLFNNTSEMIIIVDHLTNELLFVNDTSLNMIRNQKYEKEPCYKYMYGKDKPCEHCVFINNKDLQMDKSYKYDMIGPLTKSHYKMSARLGYYNDKLVRIVNAVNVSENEKNIALAKYSVNCEKMLSDISTQLIESNDYGETLKKIISEIGQFFDNKQSSFFN